MNRLGILSIFTLALILAPLLPPLLIENTSSTSRWTWLFFFGLFSLIGLFGWLIAAYEASKKRGESGTPKFKAKYDTIGASLLLSFPLVMLLSVLIANKLGQSDFLDTWARRFLDFVSYVFPWVGSLQNYYGAWVSAEQGQVLKALTVVSLWFVYGLVLTVTLVYMALVDNRVRNMSHTSVGSRSDLAGKPGMQFFCIAFGVYVATSAYFGWNEFEAVTRAKFCLFKVPCYIQDDLAIVAASMWKFFAIFGFGGGAVVIFRKFIRDPFATRQ
jgi:MFS family permease